MKGVTITEVNSKFDLYWFINLPAKIHKGHSNWVPPLYMDDRLYFNKSKNKTFLYCDTVLLLAKKGNKTVGRIMGIINHKYNEKHKLNEARFCFMETYNDQDVANKLMNAIEIWAQAKGAQKLVGPLGFSDKDPQGMLVEGFDEPMVIATNCNFPYQVTLLEQMGFSKKVDLVVYKLAIPDQIPEIYQRIYEHRLNGNRFRVVSIPTKKQLKPWIRPILTLMNETFRDIYAFDPLTEKEMDDFASRYMVVLDPKFIKVITDGENKVVAFVVAMPDISQGIKACKGRVLPFGIIKILRAQKKTKQLNLFLGGIDEKHRNKGLDAILGVKMIEEAQKAGLNHIDSHLELETNTRVRAEMERMGGVVYKRYRIFQKDLCANP